MKRWNAWLDWFLFESCSTQSCALMRVGIGLILLVYTWMWWLDYELWFSSQGVLSVETAQRKLPSSCWSLFFWIEPTPQLVQTCLFVLFGNSLLLTLGCCSRVQSAMIFFWLVSFQNRCTLIGDGEDNVLRLFAFFMIWMPADSHWSVGRLWRRKLWTSQKLEGEIPAADVSDRAWALRLIQIQMACIYISAAWCKSYGETWLDGSAVYYVSQTADYFGRGPLPGFLFETDWVVRSLTWGVLALEWSLPVFLFLPATRRLAILCGVGLHLGMEYSMHLFLFQWVMMLGVLSFAKPEDFYWLRGLFRYNSARLIRREPLAGKFG